MKKVNRNDIELFTQNNDDILISIFHKIIKSICQIVLSYIKNENNKLNKL